MKLQKFGQGCWAALKKPAAAACNNNIEKYAREQEKCSDFGEQPSGLFVVG
ncbi:MAG: hypothetical protein GY820_28700 [Gammaproteobacteria bacterium]|nr:hypothetical protein [Gammaproteobacteria bacterium]